MRILYSPILDDLDNTLSYEFIGERIIVNYNGEIDEFDFTDMPNDCSINSYDRINKGIISSLSIQPVIKAERLNGILSVELINFIGKDATDEEKFPDWIEVDTDGDS